MVQKVNSTQKLLAVFQGVWCSPEPIAELKYLDRECFSSLPTLHFPILTSFSLSYFLVNVFTDESKDIIYLKISTANQDGERVEQQVWTMLPS